ncbi:MAG TPA: hypothetical protein VMV45_08715 [Casimicrobiaceae bacterium]|nr:hypothetical protein [Casimicrobiaceae bacterium]
MHVRWAAIAVVLGLWVGKANAEAVCKPEQLKNPSPTLAEVYAMAERHAKAWKSDAVPTQISTTTLGLLQADGRAASWHLLFYSESAKSNVAIDTFRGSLNCWADAGSAGRIPDLKPDFVRDGAKLYAIAKQQGGNLIADGYGVMIGTAAAPSNRHATWNITYTKEGGKDSGLLVLVDANTGAVEKVIK